MAPPARVSYADVPVGVSTYRARSMLSRTDRSGDAIEELAIVDGLGQKSREACIFEAYCELRFGPARHHDGRDFDFLRAQGLEQFEPGHDRHVKVENEAAAIAIAGAFQKVASRSEIANPHTAGFEHDFQRIANRIVVVDDADRLIIVLSHGEPGCGFRAQSDRPAGTSA